MAKSLFFFLTFKAKDLNFTLSGNGNLTKCFHFQFLTHDVEQAKERIALLIKINTGMKVNINKTHSSGQGKIIIVLDCWRGFC